MLRTSSIEAVRNTDLLGAFRESFNASCQPGAWPTPNHCEGFGDYFCADNKLYRKGCAPSLIGRCKRDGWQLEAMLARLWVVPDEARSKIHFAGQPGSTNCKTRLRSRYRVGYQLPTDMVAWLGSKCTDMQAEKVISWIVLTNQDKRSGFDRKRLELNHVKWINQDGPDQAGPGQPTK